ncbi:MAG: epoxyqueuosine reductase [Hyphococcus sp.]|nr:MAG: epoxyqueuosine reductase [Marinicaulis sp.]
MPDENSLKKQLQTQAADLGFDVVGVSAADLPLEKAQYLSRFLEEGRHGDMGWLEGRAEQRAHPRALWAGANSVIMLGANYGPDNDPLEGLEKKETGLISVYAQNKDYHDLIKKRLKRLARWLIDEAGGEVKVFVDTAPVMEKPLAAQAGIGWQGKHTNLVSRDFGSWLFLGAIFTTLPLEPDEQEIDHCGSCSNCLDICPTNAFPAPYQLDARKCISYLTIEHKGPIPHELRPAIGNHIYGCDDCLAVCPWNKFAARSQETAFHARETLREPPLSELAALDDTEFRTFFSGSPIKRTGRDRFIRNVLIAIGNSNDKSLLATVEPLLSDESTLVRGAAIWAYARLETSNGFNEMRKQRQPLEQDEIVRSEWERASLPVDA